jgi:hypothetical protein
MSVQYQEKDEPRLCFQDSASLLLPPRLLPTSNNLKSTPSRGGDASITTMVMTIPIPTILKLTQQSMMLHHDKKVHDRREKQGGRSMASLDFIDIAI